MYKRQVEDLEQQVSRNLDQALTDGIVGDLHGQASRLTEENLRQHQVGQLVADTFPSTPSRARQDVEGVSHPKPELGDPRGFGVAGTGEPSMPLGDVQRLLGAYQQQVDANTRADAQVVAVMVDHANLVHNSEISQMTDLLDSAVRTSNQEQAELDRVRQLAQDTAAAGSAALQRTKLEAGRELQERQEALKSQAEELHTRVVERHNLEAEAALAASKEEWTAEMQSQLAQVSMASSAREAALSNRLTTEARDALERQRALYDERAAEQQMLLQERLQSEKSAWKDECRSELQAQAQSGLSSVAGANVQANASDPFACFSSSQMTRHARRPRNSILAVQVWYLHRRRRLLMASVLNPYCLIGGIPLP